MVAGFAQKPLHVGFRTIDWVAMQLQHNTDITLYNAASDWAAQLIIHEAGSTFPRLNKCITYVDATQRVASTGYKHACNNNTGRLSRWLRGLLGFACFETGPHM